MQRNETAWTVREAEPEDGPALLQLTRETPMRAVITLQLEREPDFFGLSRVRGEPYVVLAEHDGKVVGSAGIARRPAQLAHGVEEIGVIADLKVHPDLQRHGMASAMLGAIADHEEPGPPTVVFATTAIGNDAVDHVAARFAAGRGLRTVARISSRPPARGRKSIAATSTGNG